VEVEAAYRTIPCRGGPRRQASAMLLVPNGRTGEDLRRSFRLRFV